MVLIRDFSLYLGLLLFGFFTHDIFFSEMKVIRLLSGQKAADGSKISFSLPFAQKFSSSAISVNPGSSLNVAAQQFTELPKFDPKKKYFYRSGSSVRDISGPELQDPKTVRALLSEGQILEASDEAKGDSKKRSDHPDSEGLVLGQPDTSSTQASDIVRALQAQKKQIQDHAKALKELDEQQ